MNIMREYEIKNTSIKKMLKAVQLIKKFSIFALWRSQFKAKIQVIRCKLRVAAR
jgi:hypothetical protein